MPCRSGAPLVAIRNPAPARWPTTVGPDQPGEGWTATPTGLSITTIDVVVVDDLDPLDDLRDDGERVAQGRDRPRRASRRPSTRSLLATTAPSTLHVALADQLGGAGAGQPEHPGHRGVDPLAGQPLGHQDDLVVGGQSHDVAPRSASSRRAGVPSMPIPRKACITISAAATSMQMSATLKIGQCGQPEEVDDVALQERRARGTPGR